MNKGNFTSGYKFGPRHQDVHFVIEKHGNPNDEYILNFSRDLSKAKVFDSYDQAEKETFSLTQPFRLKRDEYHWCTVVCDDEGEVITMWELA